VAAMANANLQSLNFQSVSDINTVLNQAQVNALMQSLEANAQASQAAQTLTQRLRASGQINANQRVIAFRNGQVFVTNVPQRPQRPQR
jgi:hypothetical protein